MNWHHLEATEVIEVTGSSPDGLSNEKAQLQLAEYGPNELLVKKKKPAWVLFLHQFKDFMILVLIAAAIIAGSVASCECRRFVEEKQFGVPARC